VVLAHEAVGGRVHREGLVGAPGPQHRQEHGRVHALRLLAARVVALVNLLPQRHGAVGVPRGEGEVDVARAHAGVAVRVVVLRVQVAFGGDALREPDVARAERQVASHLQQAVHAEARLAEAAFEVVDHALDLGEREARVLREVARHPLALEQQVGAVLLAEGIDREARGVRIVLRDAPAVGRDHDLGVVEPARRRRQAHARPVGEVLVALLVGEAHRELGRREALGAHEDVVEGLESLMCGHRLAHSAPPSCSVNPALSDTMSPSAWVRIRRSFACSGRCEARSACT
jgi:hypothetical protein